MYVVALRGKNVYQGHAIEGLIKSLDEMPKVFNLMKERYDLSFDMHSPKNINKLGIKTYHLPFEDKRDIMLYVELIDML